MSSILKALKKIEGRKVDSNLPVWPHGSNTAEYASSPVHRNRQYQKILGFLIVLCIIALSVKLFRGPDPEPEPAVAHNPPPSSSQPSEKPTPGKPPEVLKTDAVQFPGTAVSQSSSTEAPSTTSKAPVPPSPPAEPADPPGPEQSTEPVLSETFGAPPAESAGLSLMALVWSTEPESRFIVINGKIVREGANLQGSTVVRIEEEYVVMRTDGVTWKLK